jgi:hypothetical protein
MCPDPGGGGGLTLCWGRSEARGWWLAILHKAHVFDGVAVVIIHHLVVVLGRDTSVRDDLSWGLKIQVN